MFAIEAKKRLPSSVKADPSSLEAEQILRSGLALLRRPVARFTHEDGVKGVTFSPDGKYLATASQDNTARVWDVIDGSEVARIPHEDVVNGVAFSPNGKYLATASDDNTARVQRWQSEDLTDEACARVNRNLTREEWEQYLPGEPYPKTCPNLPEPEE